MLIPEEYSSRPMTTVISGDPYSLSEVGFTPRADSGATAVLGGGPSAASGLLGTPDPRPDRLEELQLGHARHLD